MHAMKPHKNKTRRETDRERAKREVTESKIERGKERERLAARENRGKTRI